MIQLTISQVRLICESLFYEPTDKMYRFLQSHSQFKLHDEIDTVMLSEMAGANVQLFGTVCATCELGQRISNICGQIDNDFSQFNWYLFPIEVKRILPTVILYVQQPVEITFFGSFSANRELCKRVSIEKCKLHVGANRSIDMKFTNVICFR